MIDGVAWGWGSGGRETTQFFRVYSLFKGPDDGYEWTPCIHEAYNRAMLSGRIYDYTTLCMSDMGGTVGRYDYEHGNDGGVIEVTVIEVVVIGVTVTVGR
jgi:hypothetical protein